jgi:nucleoside-diphosphate-sugar epimerase
MRVLVAGATSVLGAPVIKQLVAEGHRVVGMTRSWSKSAQIVRVGAEPVVADVFDREQTARVVAAVSPDVVVSLLMTLPRFGPRRLGDFVEAQILWTSGIPNLLAATQLANVPVFVAESMVFAYGYDRFGSTPLTEDDPYPGPPPLGDAGRPMLNAMRGMEKAILDSSSTTRTRGMVLRYGIFHGQSVPHTRYLAALTKCWAMPVPTGGAIVPWVELGDAAQATVAAMAYGGAGEIYNIVDDETVTFRRYMNDLARALHRPRPARIPRALMSVGAPYAAAVFGNVELSVANTKAKRELSWHPRYPDHHELFAHLYPARR